MRAIVLSGGGLRGSFQAGALKRLEEANIIADRIYGVSTGAINAFGYAFGNSLRLVDIWKSIRRKKDIMKAEWWKLFWAKGLYNLNPLKEKMYDYVTGKPRCYACVSYVELNDYELCYVDTSESLDIFINAVLASSAQPPVIIPINDCTDGGVREQTPLKRAIDDGADEIIVILTQPIRETIALSSWTWKIPYIFSYIVRVTDILAHEVFLEDIKVALLYNSLPEKRKVKIDMIMPDREIFSHSFDLENWKILEAINHGYQKASIFLEGK